MHRSSCARRRPGRAARTLCGGSLFFLIMLCAQAADRAHTVNVYAWPDYFPRVVIARFEAETGLHVNSAVLTDPETAETLLSVGHSDYDIVTMNASPELEREIPGGFWRVLDATKIPNARNADPQIMKILDTVDPGNRHAVPWMWGTTGLIYDSERIHARMPDAPTDSLRMVFDKAVAAHFKTCGIGMLDSWGDILPMVSRYLGQRTLSARGPDLDAVVAKLGEIRPYLTRISTAGYYQQLAEGDLCLAIGYSGDALIARRMVSEAHGHIRLEYAFAREAVPFYIDSMAIPADSPNPAGALAFINFMMRPEISAGVTRYIGFATANAAALPLLEPAVRDNTIIYPPAAVRERFQLQRAYSPQEAGVFSRIWLKFKSQQ